MSPRAAETLGRLRLDAILERVAPLCVLGSTAGVEVSMVAFDSREVRPGALFCCLAGAHHDGHAFAAAARAAGAVAFVCEHSLGAEAAGAVQAVVAPGGAREAMARAACAFYRDPARSMTTVGVTGTNGKTTTTYLLRSIFEQHGWRTGVIGTLDGVRTTPESPHLQRALARQRDSGCRASAIEVTSIALVQHRVDAMSFDVGVFTNLSQDHLDVHETMEAYFAAKAGMFVPERVRCEVVNADDVYGRRLIERAAVPVLSYSLEDVRGLELGLGESRFRLGGRGVRLGLGGVFNVYNALAAAAAARALGVPANEIVAGLEGVSSVPGRFEVVEGEEGITAVVDYAHTPAGLEEVLRAARTALGASSDATPHRVLVVFGCGGDRDRGKRPAMGAVASELADHVVITSDNPRSEDPLAIIEEVRAGAAGPAEIEIEPNRRRAIVAALGRAEVGDVVVVAGKGHETTQQFADRLEHFDDREVVAEELARLAASAPRAAPRGRTVIGIFTSGGVALLVAAFGTPILMRWLTRRRIGQQVREDGPTLHLVKAGTPTMGGLAMIAAIVAGYGLGHVGTNVDFSRPGILVVCATILAGAIGLADDWLKVRHRHSLGLNKRAKFALLVAVGVAFALGSHYWAHEGTSLSFTRFDMPNVQMGTALWVVWAVLIIVAAANAVNLTDGLDGLAAGSSAFGATVMALIGYWEFRNFSIYQLPKPYALDLGVAALAIAGSCVGFLWWNAAPARIFMGDTGALAVGTGIACLALELNLQLLLPIIGGLFVVETMSVVVQVVSFRCFRTRVFRMAPLHHHFELLGWPETTVIVRFWIFSALCSALGLGVFYADFLSVGRVK